MTVRIINADVIDGLRQLPDESVHCVVTSPPYWGLRDYGVDGQIGLEPTLDAHIARMVEVFREVRRVMRKEATLWLNYGDCYATSPNGRSAADTKAAGNDDRTFRDKPFSTIGGVLKAKDLCMIPNRLAIALQEDGWWVRSEIVWGKPNPMPESIHDRPATAHEKIFLLSKSSKYFYAAEPVRQGRTSDEDAVVFRGGSYVGGEPGPRRTTGNKRVRGRSSYGRHTLGEAVPTDQRRQAGIAESAASAGGSSGRRMSGFNDRWDAKEAEGECAEGRNLRNYERAPLTVWEIGTAPFSEAHFATFPPALAERCIKAGCPAEGTVLDPFGGAGTTGLVADRLQRDAILIELNSAYAQMADQRIKGDRGALLEIMETAT